MHFKSSLRVDQSYSRTNTYILMMIIRQILFFLSTDIIHVSIDVENEDQTINNNQLISIQLKEE
jgi:hypothetical protein